MWCTRGGKNLTSAQVCDELARRCGSSHTVSTLEAAYRVGAILQNGGIWFQRLE